MNTIGVRRLPLHQPVILSVSDTLKQAAHAMESNNIGSVLVKSKSGQLLGIVTDRDLALALALKNVSPDDPLETVLIEGQLVYVTESATLEDVINTMREQRIRRIPVIREVNPAQKKCLGIITLDDLVKSGLIEQSQEKEILKSQLNKKETPSLGRSPEKTAFRHLDRKQHSYNNFMSHVRRYTGLHGGEARTFTLYVLSSILRRITPQEGKDFLSQFPYILQAELIPEISAPNRAYESAGLVKELSERFGRSSEETEQLLKNFWQSLQNWVSAGELRDVRSQLPADMQSLFSQSA